MTQAELPFRATSEEACAWLAQQTASPWTLARLLENGLIPYVWLDYDPAWPDLFGDANGGYAAPIFFAGDTARLAAGSEDVLITMTKDVHRIVTQLPAPGFSRRLDELRFQKRDLERLVAQLKRDAAPVASKLAGARESQAGINREEVMAAFGPLVRIDLDQALTGAGGIFSDEGARVKGSAGKAKHKALWNPVTLALGLNEVHRVPMPALKKAFKTHDFLVAWTQQWEDSLVLLGK